MATTVMMDNETVLGTMIVGYGSAPMRDAERWCETDSSIARAVTNFSN
jgi:hypothetical protein